MEFDIEKVVFGESHLEGKKQKTIHIERILLPAAREDRKLHPPETPKEKVSEKLLSKFKKYMGKDT